MLLILYYSWGQTRLSSTALKTFCAVMGTLCIASKCIHTLVQRAENVHNKACMDATIEHQSILESMQANILLYMPV